MTAANYSENIQNMLTQFTDPNSPYVTGTLGGGPSSASAAYQGELESFLTNGPLYSVANNGGMAPEAFNSIIQGAMDQFYLGGDGGTSAPGIWNATPGYATASMLSQMLDHIVNEMDNAGVPENMLYSDSGGDGDHPPVIILARYLCRLYLII